jgi:hypothetical protein
MTKFLILTLPLVVGAGCTTLELERQAVNQSQSAADYRYHAALHCLATVAANPNTLPSYALLSNGITTVTDTGVASPLVNWSGAPEVFAFTTLAFTGSHTPMVLWTVSPVADDTQLEAIRCACRWVLEGPEQVGRDCVSILADPEDPVVAGVPGPHFGVLGRLGRLPHGWLHVGRLCDIPLGACYKDHCGDTWVWVMADGLEGLAGFTLVLQDISTLLVAPTDGTLPQNQTPPVFATLWIVENTVAKLDTVVIDLDPEPKGDKVTNVTVGQFVRWHNTDKARDLSVESDVKSLFSSDTIRHGGLSKAIAFDDSMYKGAGGNMDSIPNQVRISYTYAYTPKGKQPGKDQKKPKATIVLSPDPFRSLYSQTLVTRMDRVVRPECICNIEQRIRDRLGAQAQRALQNDPLEPVQITWDEWMRWTVPYQGQRTAAKPGAAVSTPITVPQGRAFIPPTVSLINAQGIRIGGPSNPEWLPVPNRVEPGPPR